VAEGCRTSHRHPYAVSLRCKIKRGQNCKKLILYDVPSLLLQQVPQPPAAGRHEDHKLENSPSDFYTSCQTPFLGTVCPKTKNVFFAAKLRLSCWFSWCCSWMTTRGAAKKFEADLQLFGSLQHPKLHFTLAVHARPQIPPIEKTRILTPSCADLEKKHYTWRTT